jgi:hypothetical protein
MNQYNDIPVKWVAKAVEGHSDVAGMTESWYTSDAVPVEAEYADKLELENAELRAKLDAVPDYVEYRVGFDEWSNGWPMSLDEWYAMRKALQG